MTAARTEPRPPIPLTQNSQLENPQLNSGSARASLSRRKQRTRRVHVSGTSRSDPSRGQDPPYTVPRPPTSKLSLCREMRSG